MKLLIVAATEMELDQIRASTKSSKLDIQYYCHGIGLVSCVYNLTEKLNSNFNLVIQVGIAGTYKKEYQVGDTVFVESDQLGDEGAENNESLLTTFDLGLKDLNESPYSKGILVNLHTSFFPKNLPRVTGLTTNLSSGSSETIKKRKLKYNADIETMEGAAFHFVCLMKKNPFVQIRTISNIVEPRNKENWNIPLALSQNASIIIQYINNLQNSL